MMIRFRQPLVGLVISLAVHVSAGANDGQTIWKIIEGNNRAENTTGVIKELNAPYIIVCANVSMLAGMAELHALPD